MHCIALRCIALHGIAWHCIALHGSTLRYPTLHLTTLHYTSLHYTTRHSTPLHYNLSHHITLQSIALNYIRRYVHTYKHEIYTYIALHCTALHKITVFKQHYDLYDLWGYSARTLVDVSAVLIFMGIVGMPRGTYVYH